jgi:hypothetical protein
MATRLTYTTGARSVELDRAYESALAEANAVPYGPTAGRYYVQQFAREQSRTIVES